MNAKILTANWWFTAAGAVALAAAVWVAIECRRQDRSAAASGERIQIVERLLQQEALTQALSLLRAGEVEAATRFLSKELCDNTDMIRGIACSTRGELPPLARALEAAQAITAARGESNMDPGP